MASFVVAGKQDSSEYAKVELYADALLLALPSCTVKKLPQSGGDWDSWVSSFCEKHHWVTPKSHCLVWREPSEGNPLPLLIGDEKQFASYIERWYNVMPGNIQDQPESNAAVNAQPSTPVVFPIDYPNPPVSICVTGAAGQIAYNLAYSIASGNVFGQDQPVELRLLDIPQMEEKMKGLVMELEDCAFDLCQHIDYTTDPRVAFASVDFAVLLSALAVPRAMGSNPVDRVTRRAEILKANVAIFQEHGKALEEVAKRSTKVVVVANPSNTNALIVSQFCPSLPKENFTSLSKLDENRARSRIRAKLNDNSSAPLDQKLRPGDIRNMIVWGNHSATVVPDANHAFIANGSLAGPDETSPVRAAVKDNEYFKDEFVTAVRSRGKAVVEKRKLTPALSAARAIAQHLALLWAGTEPGTICSMGVFSDGNPFGVPEDIFFSFPVTVTNGQWQYASMGPLPEEITSQLQATALEIVRERTAALSLCGLAASPKEESENPLTNGHNN